MTRQGTQRDKKKVVEKKVRAKVESEDTLRKIESTAKKGDEGDVQGVLEDHLDIPAGLQVSEGDVDKLTKSSKVDDPHDDIDTNDDSSSQLSQSRKRKKHRFLSFLRI